MKKLALSALLVLASLTHAPADSVSNEDKRAAYQAVLSFAKFGVLDVDQRRRVLYQLCSELKGCAQDCVRELAMCAEPSTDPSQRAVLVASCALDYRQRRDAGEALHPDVWLKERLVRFLDAVASTLSSAEQRSFKDARTQARLLTR